MLAVDLIFGTVLAFLLAATFFANLLHGCAQGGLVLGARHLLCGF